MTRESPPTLTPRPPVAYRSAMREVLLKLCRREDLSREESQAAFEAVMDGTATEAQIGGLLVGLAAKGATAEELAGAAAVMRDKAVRVDAGPGVVLDTCGTGGDVKGTFNISTAAALIAAAAGRGAGVRVVKHGNRAASSRTGSADVLERLGVNLDLDPAGLRRCLDAAGICFAFAKRHHPAMSRSSDARRSLGIPTVFNVLGPLTNPAGARHQLLGVYERSLTLTLAGVLRRLGSERAWVVHAHDGLDELSTLGPSRVCEVKAGNVRTFTVEPSKLGLRRPELSEIAADSPEASAVILRSILAGDKTAARDIALLNAAAGLVVAGVADELPDGLHLAAAAIDDGRAAGTLDALVAASRAG